MYLCESTCFRMDVDGRQKLTHCSSQRDEDSRCSRERHSAPQKELQFYADGFSRPRDIFHRQARASFATIPKPPPMRNGLYNLSILYCGCTTLSPWTTIVGVWGGIIPLFLRWCKNICSRSAGLHHRRGRSWRPGLERVPNFRNQPNPGAHSTIINM